MLTDLGLFFPVALHAAQYDFQSRFKYATGIPSLAAHSRDRGTSARHFSSQV
jgi:hypothetical protein